MDQISGYLDEKGNFKIVDRRQFSGKSYGKNCNSFTVAELLDIAKYLNLYDNKKPRSKTTICKDIQDRLLGPEEDELDQDRFNNLNNLSDDAIIYICEDLDNKDLISFAKSSKRVHQVCKHVLDKRKVSTLEERQRQRELIEFNVDVPHKAKEILGFKRSKHLDKDLPTKKYSKYIIETPLTRYHEVSGYIMINPEDYPNINNILKMYYSLPHTDKEWREIEEAYASGEASDIFDYYRSAVEDKQQGRPVRREDLMGDLHFFEGVTFEDGPDNTLIIHADYGS